MAVSKATVTKPLTATSLLPALEAYPDAKKYWLAVSGGLDSTVLLHLFFSIKADIKVPIEVIYVDHQLHKASDRWGAFCEEQCKTYGFVFTSLIIEQHYAGKTGIEAWARAERYQLLAKKMAPGEQLFTAHHQDDQIETFFLQALRGAGARGLAGMPVVKPFADGTHHRPLLNTTRAELKAYAEQHNLKWCTDESNADLNYDRNYIRHQLLAPLSKRFPAYHKTITRVIAHQQEYQTLLDELAETDLTAALCPKNMCLRLDVVRSFSIARQKNLLVAWFVRQKLPSPNEKQIKRIINEMIARTSSKPLSVSWAGVTVYSYRNQLYTTTPLPTSKSQYHWQLDEPLTILGGTLTAVATTGSGLAQALICDKKITVRYRQGGERIKPSQQQYTKTIKRLFQERHILPWWRHRIPLVYVDETLAAVPGICVAAAFAAQQNEASFKLVWSGYEKVI